MGGDNGYGQKPVKWLSPSQLLRTAKEVVQAEIFARFADKREVMAGVQAPVFTLDSGQRELWFDYVADTGDGFSATYAVACGVTGARNFTTNGCDECQRSSDAPPRPLVFGGDQVYPVASADGYQDRLIDPFRVARERAGRRDDLADPVLALPGNHDWYDGLVAFRRTFGEVWAKQKYADPVDGLVVVPGAEARDDVAGWGAFQARSYYAMRLTGRWWIWGVDSQLDKPVDAAQMRYFRDAAALIGDDQGVILCVATPSWLEAGHFDQPKIDGPLDSLARFVNRVLGDKRSQVRLILTGDKHHFAHYTPTDEMETDFRPELVTCGGGGAFMSSTHHLEETLHVPWGVAGGGAAAPTQTYRLKSAYPDTATSKELSGSLRWLRVLTRNGSLPAVFVAIQLLLLLPLMRLMRTYDFLDGEQAWFEALPEVVWAVIEVSLLFLLLYAFAKHGTKHTAASATKAASLHLVAHVLPTIVCAVVVSLAIDRLLLRTVVIAGVWIALSAWSSFVFACYLHVADGRGFHELESYSGLRIEDYKCFLRVHVEGGQLELHPIGIETVPAVRGESDLDTTLGGHHIEPPFVIAAQGEAPTDSER